MKITVNGTKWNVVLPTSAIGNYSMVGFKCENGDSFGCIWQVSKNERNNVRKAILNYLAEK